MEPLILPIIDIIDVNLYQLKGNHLYSKNEYATNIFIFCEEGSLSLCWNDKTKILNAGQSYLLDAKSFKQLTIKISHTSKLLCINFSINKADSYHFSALFENSSLLNETCRGRIIAIKSELSSSYQQCFNELDKNTLKNCLCDYLITLYFIELLFLLKKTICIDKENKEKKDLTYGHDLTEQIILYMEKNLHLSLSINDLSEAFYVSPSYLKQTFKKKTGYSLINYFRTLKIEQAKYWLRDGNYSVTEISEKLGFESIHYFSRSFKNYVGFSPTTYQKSIFSIEHELDDLL